MKTPLIAIVGAGHWGKNLIREFSKIANVQDIVHKDNVLTSNWLRENYPNISTKRTYSEVLSDPKIQAVVIATPIATHFELVEKALIAGKHVFVEKPITTTSTDARKLQELAQGKNLSLFVGYVFIQSPVFRKLKELLQNEDMREIIFSWQKFGSFKENIYHNLLTHELSIALSLGGEIEGTENLFSSDSISERDIVAIKINFKSGKTAFSYINRVSPEKSKKVTVVTDKNTYLWDNDKLLKLNKEKSEFEEIFSSKVTPLEIECRLFLESIKNPNLGNSDLASKIVSETEKLI